MPRRCTICIHASRSDIDQALVKRQSFRNIAAQFEVSTSALVRHHDDHLPASLVKAQEAAEAAQADDLLAQVVDLRDKALGVLGKAEKSDDLRTAVSAIREARGCVELLGKLAGQLKDAPTVNILVSAEWRGEIVRNMATTAGQFGAAITAEVSRGKAAGLYVERRSSRNETTVAIRDEALSTINSWVAEQLAGESGSTEGLGEERPVLPAPLPPEPTRH